MASVEQVYCVSGFWSFSFDGYVWKRKTVRVLLGFGFNLGSRVRACLGAVAFAFAWHGTEFTGIPAAIMETVIAGRGKIIVPIIRHCHRASMSISLAQNWRTEVYP